MAISKSQVSVTSLSTDSDNSRLKNAPVGRSRYLGIFRNVFVSCRRGLSNVVPQKDSLSSTWRPTSLSPTLLISVTFFNALVITVLGILQWKSNRDGGLYAAEKADDIPAAVTFLHLHFPTIIAVAYSVVWSWIDLDVKRLEPWFQMSQASGAEARDSVLLHYPVDFIASVPINAAKRKQWTVVSVSTITVALFWAVTPLQSAIFSVDKISRTRSVPIAVSDSLVSLEQQADQLNTSFLNDGYSVLWQGQNLPPFTTMTSALAPLKVAEYQPVVGLNKTITYPTKRYETALNCYPPVSMETTKSLGITADNGRGCVAENVVTWYDRNSPIPFRAYYVGYFDDPHGSYSLAMGGCPKNASNTFLAIWRRSSNYAPDFDDPSNATAVFCEPSYSTQSVDAMVTFPDYSVIGVEPTGPKTPLSDEDFRMNQFHYILGTGASPLMYEKANFQQDPTNPRDISDNSILYQNAKLENMSIEVPTSNMVGFAIGSSHFAPEEYMNASKLSSSFESAHKLLFALGARDIMKQPEESKSLINGEQEYTVQAVVLVPTFTFLVQGFIVLIIILTLFLLKMSWKRRISLPSDPNSLSEVMALSTSRDLLNVFKPFDSLRREQLEDKLRSVKFNLPPADNGVGKQLEIHRESLEVDPATFHIEPAGAVTTDQTPERPAVQSRELHASVGVVFLLFLVGCLVVIIFLKQKIESNNGLPLPSSNPIVEQLLTNFLPTALATFMEPWWIVLNRIACLLQPFKELQHGKSTAWRSLSTKYTSLPPQLIFWRAMRASHFLLVIISFTGLLSNVLTVSLSGLFTRKTITDYKPALFRPLYQPEFPEDYDDYWMYKKYDHYHIAMSNISANTALPPWVSSEFYFLPVNLAMSNDQDDDSDASIQYQLPTTGIGAELDCIELSRSGSDHTFEFNISPDAVGANFSVSHRSDGEDLLRCDAGSADADSRSHGEDNLWLMGKADGSRALEVWRQAVPSPANKNSSDAGLCTESLLGGWVRANLTEHPGNPPRHGYQNVSINSMEEMFLSCRPRLKSAQFEVRVDTTGRIINSTQTGSFDDSLRGDLSYLTYFLNSVISFENPAWHNNSLSNDWMNYFIKQSTQSDNILDPGTPVPEFTSTAKVLNELYGRLFAIHFSLRSVDLVPADQDAPAIAGYRKTEKPRLFFSESMYILSVTIYAIDILVALAIYLGFRGAYLPRLPTTIASNIASFAASHIPELLTDNPEPTAESRMAELDRQGYRYGFGEFVGTDGKTHLGIERDEFVQRKEDKSKVRRRVKELTKDWV